MINKILNKIRKRFITEMYYIIYMIHTAYKMLNFKSHHMIYIL